VRDNILLLYLNVCLITEIDYYRHWLKQKNSTPRSILVYFKFSDPCAPLGSESPMEYFERISKLLVNMSRDANAYARCAKPNCDRCVREYKINPRGRCRNDVTPRYIYVRVCSRYSHIYM
jgi:hypothetical protein